MGDPIQNVVDDIRAIINSKSENKLIEIDEKLDNIFGIDYRIIEEDTEDPQQIVYERDYMKGMLKQIKCDTGIDLMQSQSVWFYGELSKFMLSIMDG